MPAISFQSVSKVYPAAGKSGAAPLKALDNVSFDIGSFNSSQRVFTNHYRTFWRQTFTAQQNLHYRHLRLPHGLGVGPTGPNKV